MTTRFPRDFSFDSLFDQIEGLVWYPFVGQNFRGSTQKLLVYAHNVPMNAETYERRKADFVHKPVWAECVEEYTYEQGWWTKAFRAFIKGAVGLKENYGYGSDSHVQEKVDAFVNRIAYINYIQGLVQSETQITTAPNADVERSKAVNKRILDVLGITHCICWGGHVFNYIASTPGLTVTASEDVGLGGFGYRQIRDESGRPMHLLKVYHPSMPSFSPFSEETQNTIADFLKRPVLSDEAASPGVRHAVQANR